MLIGFVALSAIVFAPMTDTFAKKGQTKKGKFPQIGPAGSSCTGGDLTVNNEVWSLGGKRFVTGDVITYVVPAQSGLSNPIAGGNLTTRVTPDVDGDIPCQLLWSPNDVPSVTPGIYDIIGDTGSAGPDGVYEAGVDAICENCVAILGPGFAGVIIDGVIPADIDLGDPIDIFVELENLLPDPITVFVSGSVNTATPIILLPTEITLEGFDFHVGVSYDQGIPADPGFYIASAQLCLNNPCNPLAGDPVATSAMGFEVIDPANAD